MVTRRGFLQGVLATGVAPFVVKAQSLKWMAKHMDKCLYATLTGKQL